MKTRYPSALTDEPNFGLTAYSGRGSFFQHIMVMSLAGVETLHLHDTNLLNIS
ncbi:unnamed protein product [Musa acuminata subsp. burmannicoides]